MRSYPVLTFFQFISSSVQLIFHLLFYLHTRSLFTLHFKNKKLSTNSSRDFNSVLDTINQYWIDPAKYFCPKSSYLSAIYENFKSKVLKVVESKNWHQFYQVSFPKNVLRLFSTSIQNVARMWLQCYVSNLRKIWAMGKNI